MAKLAMTDVLDELTTGDVPVKAVPIHGGWVDLDSPGDLVVGEERWNSSPTSGHAVAGPLSPDAAATKPSAIEPAPGAPPYLDGPTFFSHRRR